MRKLRLNDLRFNDCALGVPHCRWHSLSLFPRLSSFQKNTFLRKFIDLSDPLAIEAKLSDPLDDPHLRHPTLKKMFRLAVRAA
jgi:hypothetical protein